ncbi:uncharacterized protein LOC110990776, partial [Acanthaster planci]|uniref:Uncharacterized protein LOC110990776 n=1 Tax=Acanthaster planci TaxID=133434 RepID=A0A8B8A1L2_ACAPL
NQVGDIPVPSIPDVCTESPAHGKAFCADHCVVAERSSTPTGLRDFLKHCGVQCQESQSASTSGSVLDSESTLGDVGSRIANETTIAKVGDVLATIPPVACGGESVIVAQGTAPFLEANSPHIGSIMEECVEEKPTACKKDTGSKIRLQKWSRGHLFVVRGGGHIEYWQTLYKSESPSQVFIILLSWLRTYCQQIPPDDWTKMAIVYDNMCHLDNMVVARKPLPLSWPWSHMWMYPRKCIDRLHIRNHTDSECRTRYHPDAHLEENDNTISCEQTFVWLGRFKKILCAMPKTHHLFYIHRMIVRRNRYTALCYEQGYTPILPACKSANSV